MPKGIPEVGKAKAQYRQFSVKDVTGEYARSATPCHGTITYEPGYPPKGHKDEIDMAKWLHQTFGGDIVLLKEAERDSIKTPDYMWRGALWELKGSTSIKAADKRLQYAIKQIRDNPGGIILNVPELDMEALVRQLANRVKRSRIDSMDLMILVGGELKMILRYKK